MTRRRPATTLLTMLVALVITLTGGVAAVSDPLTERDDAAQDVVSTLTTVMESLHLAQLAQVDAAVAELQPQTGARADAQRKPVGPWQWPLPGQPRVVKHFDPPDQAWLRGHRGIDLAGITTSPVLAVAVGTVTYSGSIAGVGIVSVTHESGIRSTYQPVTDRISTGEQVRGGDQLGLLGDFGSHCLLRTCLHLGAVWGKRDYVDPLLFLQPWEISLLPHGT